MALRNCELLMDSGGGADIVFSAVLTVFLCSHKTTDMWVSWFNSVGHKTNQKHMSMEKRERSLWVCECVCMYVNVCMCADVYMNVCACVRVCKYVSVCICV